MGKITWQSGDLLSKDKLNGLLQLCKLIPIGEEEVEIIDENHTKYSLSLTVAQIKELLDQKCLIFLNNQYLLYSMGIEYNDENDNDVWQFRFCRYNYTYTAENMNQKPYCIKTGGGEK